MFSPLNEIEKQNQTTPNQTESILRMNTRIVDYARFELKSLIECRMTTDFSQPIM